jgi:hypothetical protein
MEPDNAFDPEFLRRFGDRDAPAGSEEAATAGPWEVVAAEGGRFAVVRAGSGEPPVAVFVEEATAQLAAAVRPAVGRAPVFQLGRERTAEGFPLAAPAASGRSEPCGWFVHFDERWAEALDCVGHLARSPRDLALALEGSGAAALEGAGAFLAAWVDGGGERPGGGEDGGAAAAAGGGR